MTASKPYCFTNWKGPELMFGEEYDEFNLMRDLNMYTTSDFDFQEQDYAIDENVRHAESCIDEAKEDVKDNLYASNDEGLFNLNTIVSDNDQSQICKNEAASVAEASCRLSTGNSEFVQVEHLLANDYKIFVTKIRHDRILKQRKKRLLLLELMPKLKLAYKDRPKEIKYKTRSEMAKARKRNCLGKFSDFKRKQK